MVQRSIGSGKLKGVDGVILVTMSLSYNRQDRKESCRRSQRKLSVYPFAYTRVSRVGQISSSQVVSTCKRHRYSQVLAVWARMRKCITNGIRLASWRRKCEEDICLFRYGETRKTSRMSDDECSHREEGHQRSIRSTQKKRLSRVFCIFWLRENRFVRERLCSSRFIFPPDECSEKKRWVSGESVAVRVGRKEENFGFLENLQKCLPRNYLASRGNEGARANTKRLKC